MTIGRLRRPVQLLVLALFLALFAIARRPDPPLPADLFIRLDPLAGLSSALAGRTIPTRFAPALILVAVTLLLGRAWCGWLSDALPEGPGDVPGRMGMGCVVPGLRSHAPAGSGVPGRGEGLARGCSGGGGQGAARAVLYSSGHREPAKQTS